jgi:O-antigen/teichoic acid export membrane protein
VIGANPSAAAPEGAANESVGESGQARAALPLVTNAVSVMVGKTATMAFGFLFWLIAARQFDRPAVGLAAGAVSAMMLCTQLAVGGVGSAVITHFPRYKGRHSRLLDASFAIVVLTSLVAAAAFLVLAKFGLHRLGAVSSDPRFAFAFVLTVVFGTAGILFDQVSVALRRGDQVLVRGVAFGVVTVVSLLALHLSFHRAGSLFIFAPWAIAGMVACAVGTVQISRALPGYRFRGDVDLRTARELMRVGLPNYALTLTERGPGLILPIAVTEVLTPADNATWYAVWMMAWVIYTIPISTGLALFAEGSHRPEELTASTRRAIKATLVIGLAAMAFVGLAAPLLLRLLGRSYAETGAEPLRILVLAFVPLTFVQAYFSNCRAKQRLGEAIATGVVAGVVGVGVATAAGARYGLPGMALAWVVVQACAGVWGMARLKAIPIAAVRSFVAERGTRALDAAWRSPTLRYAITPRLFARRISGWTSADTLSLLLAAIAVDLWVRSLPGIDLSKMTGLGLASVLPTQFYLAFVVLVASFVLVLARPNPRPVLLAAHVAVLIVMLFGTTSIIEHVPRFAVTWRHIGVAQAIQSTGQINSRIDAYFNWPGFFVLVAALAKAAGLSSPAPLVGWAPVYFNVSYLFPLLVIFRSVTASRRLIWLSVWIFYLGNWIGQDYFSPQGFSFFFYLAVLALLLHSFTRHEAMTDAVRSRLRWMFGRQVAPRSSTAASSQSWPLVATVVLLFAVTVPMHQLTPVALLLAASGLVIAGLCRWWWLPVVMACLIAGWWVTGALEFFKGHLGTVLGNAGSLNQAVSANVTSRAAAGDFDHRVVVDLSILAGACLWALAGLGTIRALRRKERYAAFVVLAVAPVPLLILQTYGGEMLLRVQLFALPFTAFLAAAALVSGRPAWHLHAPAMSSRRAALVGGVTVALTALFLFARYGNERVNIFTRQEVAGVQDLYTVARPKSLLISATGDLPWKYRDYQLHRYRLIIDMPEWRQAVRTASSLGPVVNSLHAIMANRQPTAYLIITTSEKYESDQFGYGRAGQLTKLEAELGRSPDFQTVFENADARIFAVANVTVPVIDNTHAHPERGPETLAARAAPVAPSAGSAR